MKRKLNLSPRSWFDTRHSLQRTLFWSFALVIILPMLLVGSVVTYSGVNTIRQNTENTLSTVAQLKENAINRWLDSVMSRFTENATIDIAKRTLYGFERRPALSEHLISRFRLDMLSIMGNADDFSSISLLDADGILKVSTNNDEEIGTDYSGQNIYIVGINAPYISPLRFNTVKNRPELYIAVPISEDDGTRVGVLVGEVKLNTLQEVLGNIDELGPQSESYLATQSRDIIASDLSLRATNARSEGIEMGFIEDVGVRFYDNYVDEPVVGAERLIERIGAILVVEQSQEAAFAPVLRTANILLLITIVILAVVSVLGYMLTNRIVAPVKTLTDIATDIAGGNLDRNIEIFREDEIGVLANAFSNMTHRLREFINTLEERVQQRTQALAHRGAQLRTAMEVSKTASTTLETETLLQQAVDLIKSQFGFYYVGLFLVDEAYQWAVLKSGTGEAGIRQLEDRHRLRIDEQSMIGWSIVHREPRISGQVTEETVRFENPYLPNTRSEMALPLISRGQVMGALSIQSTQEDAFTQEDIDVLQTVADQIANALQNSQLFNQIQSVQARFQELYHRAPIGYHTLSLDGTIKEINETELEMLGYGGQRENIVGNRNITDFLTDEGKAEFEKMLDDFRQGRLERAENIELTYRHADGSTIPISTTLTMATERQGGIREIYATVQNIRHQKEVEEAREALLQEANIMYALGQNLLNATDASEIYTAGFDAAESLHPSWGMMVLMYRTHTIAPYLEVVSLRLSPNANPKVPLEAGTTFQLAEHGFNEVIASQKTLTSTDGTKDPQFQEPLRNLMAVLGWRGMATVPLVGGDHAGFLLVANLDETTYRGGQLRLLENIGRQVSITLNNYLNLRQAIQRAAQLQAAAEVAKTTTAQTDLATLLPTVAELLVQRFNYYAVTIFLVDDYRQNATIEAVAATNLPEAQRGKMLHYKLPLSSRSQVSTAIARGTVQNSPDVGLNPVFREHPQLPETRSEITLPLVAQQQVIGALDVQSTALNTFDASTELVLQTIADQLANAINVIRLLESERANAQEIQTLHRHYLEESWSAYLQSHDSPEQDMFTIDPNGEQLTTDWLLSNGNGDKGDATYVVLPAENGDEQPAVSALVSPLTLRGATLGALALIDTPDRTWTEDERAIIEAVSSQAALAIDNARLIEQTERWVAALQTSSEIGQAITATLDLNELLAHSVFQVQTRFGFRQVDLYLTDPASGNWDAQVISKNDRIDAPQSAHTTLQYGTMPWRAIHQRQTVVAQDAKVNSLAWLPDDPGVKSALALPLVLGQETIGALALRASYRNAFDQNLIAVLEILATQIATSIGNAKAYQEERNIAEQLREVDKLKTQFLANMSHELRTPLNSIIGFSRVILKGIDGPLTEMQRTDLSSIHQSGRHLLDLINNILDLSKIEAGKMELSFAPTNLKALLDGTISTAIGLVKDKDVKIIAEIPEKLPLVWGDETRLRQVLLNLVSNAAKFTEKGSITIAAGADADNVWLRVKDTGIGIEPENQQRIFDEFMQVDGSTTRKSGGTGLGLPITKKFIEMHKGTITVDSSLGKGSTFVVTLPRATDAVEEDDSIALVPKPALQTGILPSTLLVIDGDARVAEYYRQFLEGTDVSVLTHPTGEGAVEMAKTHQPAAILLDILLPDMSGWQVLEDLMQNPHTAHIPVVIASIVEDRFRATQLGATDYLVKPIIKTDLLAAMEKLGRLRERAKKVLVIDDHADDILLIRRILESRACVVLSATDGVEGLAVIEQNRPDLIILDLTMPKLDGFEVLKTLAEAEDTKTLPVLVISARTLSESERMMVDDYAVALLSKGNFTDADLLQYVDAYLSPSMT